MLKLLTLGQLLLTGRFSVACERYRIWRAQRRLARANGSPVTYPNAGFTMVCYPDWPDSVAMCGRDNELWEMQLVQRWLRPGDTAFDLGANAGLYTFASANAVGRSGHVVSVDADPFIVARLRESAEILDTPQVTPVHAAIDRDNGNVTFYVHSSRRDTGRQSLRPSSETQAAGSPITVPARTLEKLLEEQRVSDTPALVKVDIEGAEGQLFATVPNKWLTASGPFWLVELNPIGLAEFGTTIADILTYLPDENFERWILSKHPIDPSAPPKLSRLTSSTDFTDSTYYNLFALPRGAGARIAGVRRFLPAA